MARNRCSVETNSSLNFPASANAPSSTRFKPCPTCCWAKPLTLGRRLISFSISDVSVSTRTPSRSRSGGTTPSLCAASAARRCKASICWFSWRAATSCACCSRCRACTDIHLDLLRLRFLTFRNQQRKHAVVIVGLDRFGIHAVCQREAPAERSVGALHAQVVFLAHLILELAFAAQGQQVVFDADVQVLRIHVRQVRLHHQFVLGLVDIHVRRPGGKNRLIRCPPGQLIEETMKLLGKEVRAPEGLPSGK